MIQDFCRAVGAAKSDSLSILDCELALHARHLGKERCRSNITVYYNTINWHPFDAHSLTSRCRLYEALLFRGEGVLQRGRALRRW